MGGTYASRVGARTGLGLGHDVEATLIHSLETYVVTNHRVVASRTVTLREAVQFSFPTTWWGQFRATRHGRFWKWTRRRWPVKYTNHTRKVQKTEQVDLHSDLIYPLADFGPIERLGRPYVLEHSPSRTP